MTSEVYPSPAKRHRFHFLDALRGIAALFVVVWHLPQVFYGPMIDHNGILAVDFFFCLSGFVIAFSYERRLTESITLKTFTVARLIRLYPMYLLGSLLGIAVAAFNYHALAGSPPPFGLPKLAILALLMLPVRLFGSFPGLAFPLDSAAWSLFLEIITNLAYALLIKLRAAQNRIIAIICASSLIAIGLSLHYVHTLDVGWTNASFFWGFARAGFSFFAGILICRFYRYRSRPSSETTKVKAAPGLLSAMAITLCLAVLLMSPLGLAKVHHFRLLAIVFFFPMLVYLGALVRLPHKLDGIGAALGELSYPLYILHFPLIAVLRTRRAQSLAIEHTTLAYLTGPSVLFALVILSYLVARNIDKPISRTLTRLYNAHAASTNPKSMSAASQLHRTRET